MRKLFGTDGIRAVAGEAPLDRRTIWAVGVALATTLKAGGTPVRVVMGMDTRESGPWIAAVLAAGLREGGAAVESAGVITTPAIAFLARKHGFSAGVVISASHNPWEDNGIKVFGSNGYKLPEALDQVRTVLRIDRRVPYSKPDNFALSTAEQMVADFRQITAITFIVMAVLSSIGLLVGGIGVMNIMLVSVTERTHEIGVRKAVGARTTDILIQFLLEAAVLTGLGGLAGILFGWMISLISRLVFTSIPASVPLWAAVTGVVVSVATGLFFGIWPANKAARLDPVEALRYE